MSDDGDQKSVRTNPKPSGKSKFREYVESIGMAVSVALLLRGFVVEPFQIPSASMEPTLLVGDFLFVQKFTYGLRLPFTRDYVARWHDVQRGDIVVFGFPVEEVSTQLLIRRYEEVAKVVETTRGRLPATLEELREAAAGALPPALDAWGQPLVYEPVVGAPRISSIGADGAAASPDDLTIDNAARFPMGCLDPGSLGERKDYIKRVIGLPGDTVELRNNQLFLNGEPVPREPIETPKGAKTFYAYSRETLPAGPHFATGYSGRDPDFGPIKVREGNVFAMGDNRDNSSDGRCWGQVPQDNIKGKALFIFFSSESESGVRTERIFQSVD
jgi:signal peptidase I